MANAFRAFAQENGMSKGPRLISRVAPKADESLLGYIVRLTESNDYDTPSWILQLADIQEYMQCKVNFSFNDKLALLKLATLTGVELDKLTSLVYQPVDYSKRKSCNHLVFGSPAPKYIIRPQLVKVCPGCLRESVYVRKIWELTLVTSCPIHKCLLLDHCPNCARRLPYNRKTVSCCTCNFDWRGVHPKRIKSVELATSRQIYALCNLPGSIYCTSEEAKHNPIYTLRLLDFTLALFFIASQYKAILCTGVKRRIDTQGKCFNFPMTNAEIHQLLCKGFSAYDNWPINFFAFLDWRREQGRNSKYTKGLSRDFAEYKYVLYKQLDSPSLHFIREAFEEYLSARWCGGYASNIKRINEAARQKARYISFNDAVKVLKVGRNGLKALIAEGRINAIVRHVGKTNMTLIELRQINELRAQLEQLLSVTQAKNMLGIDREHMPELLKHNLLRLHLHPTDQSNPYRYNRQEINDLLLNIKARIPQRSSMRGSEKISFTIALRSFRNHGVGLGQVVKLVLDGKISPCAMKASCGLGGLIFYESDVANYQRLLVRRIVNDTVKVGEAARILGLQKTLAYFLINIGLLRANRVAIGKQRILFITTKSIDKFSSDYILPATLAVPLHTSPAYLTKLLIAEKVKPVSGPTIDKGRWNIFRRRDLSKVNIEELIEKGRRHQRSRVLSSVIDLNEASKILGISKILIREYTRNGILKPYKHQASPDYDNMEPCFSRRSIENFKAQSTDFRGLVSASVAASMLNRPIHNFYVKYVKTGRLLKVIDWRKRGKQFFRRQEVESLVELEKETIGSPEVAEILKVSMSSIYRMTVSKELQHISGPLVDGYPINLFLRSDVEELNKTREAFRAECVRAGKTARFSKQPGRRSCPAQEKVIHRIKQLVEERPSRGGVMHRLEGLALHRQLVKEGYKIGTTTVYKILHKQLEETPMA